MRTLLPQVSLQRWESYAHDLLDCAAEPRSPPADGDAGIVVVVRGLPRPEPETIVGLSGYRLAADLSCGLTLEAHPFLALDLFDRVEVARRLLGVLEDLAAAACCTVLHLRLHEPDGGNGASWLMPLLAEAGHRLEARHSCKSLNGKI